MSEQKVEFVVFAILASLLTIVVGIFTLSYASMLISNMISDVQSILYLGVMALVTLFLAWLAGTCYCAFKYVEKETQMKLEVFIK